jgi:hypothetical protein
MIFRDVARTYVATLPALLISMPECSLVKGLTSPSYPFWRSVHVKGAIEGQSGIVRAMNKV